MEYIYATLTLNELEQELNQENITRVLEAAGADVIESRVKAIVAALEEVDIEQLGLETETLETARTPPVVVGDEAGIGSTDVDTDAAGDTPEEPMPGEAFVEELFDEEEATPEDRKATETPADDDASTEDSVEAAAAVDDAEDPVAESAVEDSEDPDAEPAVEDVESPVAESAVDEEEASSDDVEEA